MNYYHQMQRRNKKRHLIDATEHATNKRELFCPRDKLTNGRELFSPGDGLVILEEPIILVDDQLHDLEKPMMIFEFAAISGKNTGTWGTVNNNNTGLKTTRIFEKVHFLIMDVRPAVRYPQTLYIRFCMVLVNLITLPGQENFQR
jgi:hypothetical protein